MRDKSIFGKIKILSWISLVWILLMLVFVHVGHAKTRSDSLDVGALPQPYYLIQLDDTQDISSRLQMVGQIGGPIQAVAIQGNYAYVGVGLRLVVLDVSEPITPKEIGNTTPFLEFVNDVAVSDTLIFAAVGSAGLRIVDISDPNHPAEAGAYDTPGYAEGVVLVGQYAYIADGPYGLRILDVSDPKHPTETAYAYPLNYVFDVTVDGDFAYLAAAGAGLLVVDVSDPKQPIELGSIDTPGYAYGVEIEADTLYVADGWEGLRVIDASEPTHLVEMGSYDTPGLAFDVDVEEDIGYVADAFKGLRVIDLSSPSLPVELGAYEVKGHAGNVVVVNNNAYVADRDNGLRIIDISDHTLLNQVGLYSSLVHAEGVTISGNYAYVAAGANGLHIIDISNPNHPKQIGQFDTEGYANCVSVISNYAYVTNFLDPHGLYVVDITDPFNPMGVSFFENEGGPYRDLAISGDVAYLADEWGLSLIDISNPQNPSQIGFIYLMTTSGHAIVGLDVKGTLAYLAMTQLGIKIVDVSDHENMPVIGTFTHGSIYASNVTLVENRAYMSGDGLRVLDISNPASPIEMGFFDAPDNAEGEVAVEGGIAYVAHGPHGVYAVDVSNPWMLNLVAHYDTLGYAGEIEVSDNYVYVADGSTGLLILKTVPSNGLSNQVFHRTVTLHMNNPQAISQGYSTKPDPMTESEQTGQLFSNSDSNIPKDISLLSDILVVTTTADGGQGSLRWCIENAQPGGTITFDSQIFPPDNPVTIMLSNKLPMITQGNITIDASDAGVILDGELLQEDANGIHVFSDGNTIKGLQILRFPNIGMMIFGNDNLIGGDRGEGRGPVGQGNVISQNGGKGMVLSGNNNVAVGNLVGTDVTGTRKLGNGGHGIHVVGRNNRVGGTNPDERNIISGNGENSIGPGVGLNTERTNGNSVVGNYIGTDITGNYEIGNTAAGVVIEQGAFNNLVEGNVISGNGWCGVTVADPGSSYNTIIGNTIGLDVRGEKALGNEDGVCIGFMGASFNRVGGTTQEERNIISGNHYDGLGLGGNNNVAIGNYIGTDWSGTQSIGNNSAGIRAEGERIFIGGMTDQERNIISGNGASGIVIWSNYSFVAGNYVGTDVKGMLTLYNNNHGILLESNAAHNVLQSNLISGNEGIGVSIDSGASFNDLRANRIGLAVDEVSSLSNGMGGVQINGPSNTIGGLYPEDGNTIAFNNEYGVQVLTCPGNTIRRNSIYSNSGFGIFLVDGGNNMLPSPIITDLLNDIVYGTACAGCIVEVFSDDENEGRVFEGNAIADGNGDWKWTGTLHGNYVTATATDEELNTSGFSDPQIAGENLIYPTQIVEEEDKGTHLIPPSLDPDKRSELSEESIMRYVKIAIVFLVLFILLILVFSRLILSRREK
jgi:parallel beta-helix repeat protein